MGATVSLYALALELVAFFGFLCLLLNVLLPLLAFVLRFVLVAVPHEWKKWQLHRSQQRELRRLQRRVDTLTRRKLADEQDARRRAKKRQQAENTPVDGRLHPIVDLVSNEEESRRTNERMGKDLKQEQTPQQQRHRLGIYSTAKKPASNMRERRRMRDEEDP
ncbi:hypothetical protein PF005_g2211 [Phytophthora fragariae]|uniref:Uncharacterized protein n=1 Tax=Phytophthora fragariae TaxID=53985 RepID=A0A6A4ES22_9STRA|nr:hypothetical protein PF003_g20083 [Phytophthora fragariae]KAE8947893.1 hypothetical protein PF009_g2513 [Phytophthora fragariae]KAE9028311.1 hypothetical protein PF011_g1638 [Phytophthora fragariae]KAE9135897.1 hypothetical protein PF010_g1911 [Phytophthora fragariae]KAE9136258.1 hypothetical protein PF007_g2267 [Phytophthora fragariae]